MFTGSPAFQVKFPAGHCQRLVTAALRMLTRRGVTVSELI